MTLTEIRDQHLCLDFQFYLNKGYKLEMVSEIVGAKYYISADRAYEIFRLENKDKTENKKDKVSV